MVVFGPLVLLLISMIVKQNEFEGSLNNHMSVSVPFQMLSKQNAKCINQGISSTNQIKYASVDKINVYKCVKYLVYIYIFTLLFSKYLKNTTVNWLLIHAVDSNTQSETTSCVISP